MSKQCKKCPWLVDVDPFDIPDGYCPEKHAALKSTIATGFNYADTQIRMMACHESPVGNEKPCAGWLANQLGPGNNIGLRMMAIHGVLPRPVLIGEQHERFEDTLPNRNEYSGSEDKK